MGASGKIIFPVGRTTGTHTGGARAELTKTGVEKNSICVTDFAHSNSSARLSVRTSGAGRCVRGLESPGLQRGSV